MNIEKYKFNINELNIYFFTFIATGIFLAVPFGLGPNLDTLRDILTFGILVFMFFHFLLRSNKRIFQYNRVLNKYMLVYLSILVFEAVRSTYMYHYSFSEIYYSLRHYLWVIIAYPILYLFVRYDGIDRVMKIIVKITIFSLFLRFITWLLYSYAGINLFPNLLYEYGISWARNSIIRIDATPLISLLVIFTYYFYIKTKQRKFLIWNFFSIAYVVIVSQTRTLLISCLLTILVMFLFKNRQKINKFAIRTITACIIVLGVSLGAYNSILEYLNLNVGVKGLDYRYYEFLYYWNLLKNNWQFGMGILSTQNSFTKSVLFGNLDTKMYLDDLGIFSSFFEFGLLSIFLYGMLFHIIIKTILKCYKNREIDYAVLLIGIFCYLVACSIPLNLFGIQRIFSLPFILAITSFVNRKID